MTQNYQNTLQSQWEQVYGQLSKELGDKIALRWLKKIVPQSLENNRVSLRVPSPCIQELVKQNYADQILSLWKDFNPGVGAIAFELEQEPQKAYQADVFCAPSPIEKTDTEPQGEGFVSYLDPNQTFDSFVVGKPNQFAFAAAKKVAEEDTIAFNPLYLHSAVGLGKTHLMHAIAWKMKETFPEKAVVYLSSEQFFHRFIKSLRTNETESFRDLFRSVDVLIIDDIQFIFGKKATQEEFFHTFNALIEQGKKIILSSDSSPLELQGIEERLKTRIAQGLVVGIHATSYELRLGILQQKVRQLKAIVPADVLEFLAQSITSNVRELEGALKRIVAHSELMGSEISIEATKVILKDMLSTYEKPVSVPEIQAVVARYYGISMNELKSTRRDRKIARPRQLAMYLSKNLTTLSLPDIANYFERDHTTIMHAVKTIDGLLQRDPLMKQDVAQIQILLKDRTHGEHS